MSKPPRKSAPQQVAPLAKKKPTGNLRRKDKKGWEERMQLRTYRPDELLAPAEVLLRFKETAERLIAELPEDERPGGSALTTALRQAVLEAFRTREEHVARLVEADLVALDPDQSATTLRRSIRGSLLDMGVRVVDQADETELFVVVEGDGDAFEVLRPAYVDQATGKLILSGQLRRVPAPGGHTDVLQQNASQGEHQS
ncbi:hypothetical protein PV341_12180 [Streptomyces sp. PA03-1a]|nr:hypothetical protein [Streptomyces sp. PA03-1a]